MAGRVALVTGGTRGIGRAIVERLKADGFRVAAGYSGNDEAARKTAEELDIMVVKGNVGVFEDAQRAVREVEEKLGPVEVLVNNAGRDDRHRMDEVTVEYWDDCLAVNLRHQFFATQAAAAGMRARGTGSVVNLGSVSWMRGRPGMVGYTTAKAAIAGLTRTLARELGADGIRVNCIVPGAIVTERQRRLWLTPETDQQFLELQALKVRLEPMDVARLALFLGSDESRGCTGQDFIVDAGLTLN